MKQLILVIISTCVLSACKHTVRWTCDDNCKTGYGTKKWSDGSYERGTWRNGIQYGKGEQYLGYSTKYSGDVYIGNFDNGYDGYGTYYGKKLDFVHKGYWRHGKPNGYGETIFGKNSENPGENYKGNWKNGIKVGYGESYMGTIGRYAGITYKGNWANGNRDGAGIYIFPDSSKYIGSSLNDLFEGEATFVFSDGLTFKGNWHNGNNQTLSQYIEKHKDKYPMLARFFAGKD